MIANNRNVSAAIKKQYGYDVKLHKADGVIRFCSDDKEISDTLLNADAVYCMKISDLTIDRWVEEFADCIK